MNEVSLIMSTIAICVSAFCLLHVCGIVHVKTKTEDKYGKYRNKDGLYGGKKNE